MIKKIGLVILIIFPFIILCPFYFLGVLTYSLLSIDLRFLTTIMIVINVLFMTCLFINMIIDTINSQKMKTKKPSEAMEELLATRKELTSEVDLIREKILKGYKKEYIRIIIVYAIVDFIVYLNGINYQAVLSLSDEFNLHEAYFTSFIFSLISPVIALYVIIVCYINLKRTKASDDESNNYPHVYEFVRSVFKDEGIDKDIKIILNFDCNIGIYEEKDKIVITISVIFLKFLTNEELKAMLYHEMAHYLNNDTKTSIIFKKYKSRLDLLLPLGVSALYAPNHKKVLFELEVYELLSKIVFEKRADDLVLERNMGRAFSNASFKTFALELASRAEYIDFYEYLSINLHYDEILLNMRFKEISDFYYAHLDFFRRVAKNHLPLQLSTHPTVKERIDKFSSGCALDTDLIDNHEYDSDFVKLCDYEFNDRMMDDERYRSYWINSEQHYKDYLKKKDDVISKDYEINDDILLALADEAMYLYDVDFAKSICYKLLEFNPNNSRINLLLGGLLFQYDLSDDCIPYLQKVVDDDKYAFNENAYQLLLEYYTYVGYNEEKEELKKKALKYMDKKAKTDKVFDFNIGQKLKPFASDSVKEGLRELVKDDKEVLAIIAGVKTHQKSYCVHFILIIDPAYLDEDKVDNLRRKLESFLDLKNDKYLLHIFSFKNIPVIYNKKKLIIYKRINKR